MAGAQNRKHKNILVTGGAGFIGSNLVKALVQKNMNVVALDNLSSGKKENLSPVFQKIKFVKGSILNLSLMKKLIKGQDVIYHLAAHASVPASVEKPLYDFKVNATATVSLLKLAIEQNVKRVLFASSAGTYGYPVYTPMDENHPTYPINPYSASKLAAERVGLCFQQCYGLEFVALRIFHAYGPGQTRMVIYDLLEKLCRDKKRLEVLGDGTQVRDFCYITDVVSAFLWASRVPLKKHEPHVFNLSGEAPISIKDLAKRILKMYGYKDTRIVCTGKSWPGDMPNLAANMSRTKKYGFTPKVSLDEGLDKVSEWFNRIKNENRD